MFLVFYHRDYMLSLLYPFLSYSDSNWEMLLIMFLHLSKIVVIIYVMLCIIFRKFFKISYWICYINIIIASFILMISYPYSDRDNPALWMLLFVVIQFSFMFIVLWFLIDLKHCIKNKSSITLGKYEKIWLYIIYGLIIYSLIWVILSYIR